MKLIWTFMLSSYFLFSAHYANKLPFESRVFIDSFKCFSKDDKTMMTAYLLALKYRIDNVEKRNELVKTELDYWRLWHIVSDIEQECKLNYRFSNLLEETLVHTSDDRKKLKKLRRVEGSIHVDGASELSAKMDRYDAVLRKITLLDSPKHTILSKNNEMKDYNLSTLKNYKNNTIPQNIATQIDEMKATSLQKDTLRRVAYLKEETIRSYDKPEKRKEMKQEILYLEACQREFKLYANSEFHHNFKRKLAENTGSSQYYGLKTDFLPKEIEYYCEHNITKMKLGVFTPKVDKAKKIKTQKVKIKLENLTTFLKKYDKDVKKKKYAREYLLLMKSELNKSSTATPSLEALKLLSLKKCIVGDDDKEDFNLILSRVKDFCIEGIKERFYSNIFNSQRWWLTTIRLKMDSEGKSEEMKHFFDCNKVNDSKSLTPSISVKKRKVTPLTKGQIKEKDKLRQYKHNMRMAGDQKREILKYYCGTFDGKSTVGLNNEVAIKSGIIPKKFLSKDNKITPLIDNVILIKGLKTGGMSLTYKGLKKGKECEELLNFTNMDETIYFANNSYYGVDYMNINKTKIMIDNFSMEYVKKLCSKQELNDVSFVMINPIKKYKYSNKEKPAVSMYGNASSEVVDIAVPKGFTKVINTHTKSPMFMLVGKKAYMVSKKIDELRVFKLEKKFNHILKAVISKDAKLIARHKSTLNIYNIETKKLHKIKLTNRYATPQLFLKNNTIIVTFSKKKIRFIDIKNSKVIQEIQPKFIAVNKKYFTPRLKYIEATSNAKELYIMSDKGEVEIWKEHKSLSGFEYIYDKNLDTKLKLVNSMLINPYNENEIIYATRNSTVLIVNRITNKILTTLKADRRMMIKHIDISSDQKYLMAYGHKFIYIWSLENAKLIDVIGSQKSELHGAMFAHGNPSKIIRVGRKVEIWSIK